MATFIIDVDAASNGTGTEGSPYNDPAEYTGLTDSQSGDKYLFKRGTTITSTLANTSVSNVTLGAYNEGVAALAAKPIVDVGLASNYPIHIAQSDITVRDMDARNGLICGVWCNNSSGVMDNIKLYNNDSSGNQSTGVAGIAGKPVASSTGWHIANNYTYDNVGNSLEMDNLDGNIVEDNLFTEGKQGIELWLDCINGIYRRNHLINDGSNRGIWLADGSGGGTTNHSDNLFENNILEDVNTGVHFESLGTGNIVRNNTIVTQHHWRGLWIEAGSAFDFINNIVYQKDDLLGGGEFRAVTLVSGTEVGSTIDSNVYYSAGSGGVFWNDGTTYDNLAAWIAASGGANEFEGDPLFTDLANGDFTLTASSPCLYTSITTQTSSGEDINKNARYGGVDVGAIQFQRHPDITTGLSLD